MYTAKDYKMHGQKLQDFLAYCGLFGVLKDHHHQMHNERLLQTVSKHQFCTSLAKTTASGGHSATTARSTLVQCKIVTWYAPLRISRNSCEPERFFKNLLIRFLIVEEIIHKSETINS